jgi:hypothetical protein
MPFAKWRRFQAGNGKGRARFVGHFRPDLFDRATSTGNPTVIGSELIYANTLHRNGVGLRFHAIGTLAATAGAKVILAKFGNTTMVTYTPVTVSGSKWVIEGTIWRCAAGSQAFIVKTFNSVDALDDIVVSTTMAEDETVDNVLAIVGDAAAGADIITCRVLSTELLG